MILRFHEFIVKSEKYISLMKMFKNPIIVKETLAIFPIILSFLLSFKWATVNRIESPIKMIPKMQTNSYIVPNDIAMKYTKNEYSISTSKILLYASKNPGITGIFYIDLLEICR